MRVEVPTLDTARRALRARRPAGPRRLGRSSALVFLPFVLALAVYTVAFLAMRPPSSGDEPHYLLVAESLAYDGDLDLANDYASRERTLRVYGAFPLSPYGHAFDYKKTGELRPVHGVGLSAVAAPFVALGGLTGVRLLMLLLTALLAYQLYQLLGELGFGGVVRLAAWLAAAFSLPVVVYSNQVFTELPGALLVIVALRVAVRKDVSTRSLWVGSIAAAALIWLHLRFVPLSVGLLLALAYRASLSKGPAPAVAGLHAFLRARLAGLRRGGRAVALPLFVPFAVAVVTTAVAFEYWYGSPAPGAQYDPFWENTLGGGGWRFWYDFALPDVFDPRFGWLPFAPVHWLGLAAIGCLIVRFGWPAAAALFVGVGYLLAVESVGVPAGWGFPARFLLTLIPLIAIPIAVALRHVLFARLLVVPLLALSLLLSAVATRHVGALYPLDAPRLLGLRSFAAAFPRPRRFPTAYDLYPGQFKPHVGKLEGTLVTAKAGRDQPGILVWGPNGPLKAGRYIAEFQLGSSGARPGDQVATLDVIGAPDGALLAQRAVFAQELARRPLTSAKVEFITPGSFLIQTRVFFHGKGQLTSALVRVRPAPPVPPKGGYPDWPLLFLWIAGTVVIGGLFVQTMEGPGGRAPRRTP